MIYLNLGTNIEPRRSFLKQAYAQLQDKGYIINGKSYIYETPALLPLHASNDWQKNFLNQVIAIESALSPNQLLQDVKSIESNLGRDRDLKWGPRPIDIDILLYHQENIDTATLKIPHPGLPERNFYLRPLLDVAKTLKQDDLLREYQPKYDQVQKKLPQWMYILNITPDSFSSHTDDKNYVTATTQALENGAHIIDVGAESTRPGAQTLTADEEWIRLHEYLPIVISLAHSYEAKVSVDTYHPETMKRAISLGADIINDVSGLSSPEVRRVYDDSNVEWIAMHNLGLPANPKHILPKDTPAHVQLVSWVESLPSTTCDKRRLTIDPGIGFGKDAQQSRDILANWQKLKNMGYPILIGHSRKSFLTGITEKSFHDRDIETIALSLRLAEEGVDILRIHNMEAHKRALLSFIA